MHSRSYEENFGATHLFEYVQTLSTVDSKNTVKVSAELSFKHHLIQYALSIAIGCAALQASIIIDAAPA